MRHILMFSALLFFTVQKIKSQQPDTAVNALLKEAIAYENGSATVVLNPERAIEMYKTCAAKGSGFAMFRLGLMCEKGKGTAKNYKEALKWYEKACEKNYRPSFYRTGYLYKKGYATGKPDYLKAYNYFCRSAELEDAAGIYYKGYMHYTGLGCMQDYEIAYRHFQIAAKKGNANAMRFVGLCMRNGYGTSVNSDSAMYWLKKASRFGNGMSDDEISSSNPENAELAGTLVEKLKVVEALLKKGKPVNTFTKIENSIPAGTLEGIYEGWLVKYDWSGKHVVRVDKLKINIAYSENGLSGEWVENDTLIVPLKATLTRDAILFSEMRYQKFDHYYKKKPEDLSFRKISAKLIQENDSSFLCGNLFLYSERRAEPAKPMYIALHKTLSSNSQQLIKYTNEDGSNIVFKAFTAYPNPFTDIINIEFELQKKSSVSISVFSVDGNQVHTVHPHLLDKGYYQIPLMTQNISPGTYIIRLTSGNKSMSVKVIKMP
jgi:uncharacterized protein